jgi:hypothetical protein
MRWEALPPRPLDSDELRQLVDELAEQPAIWLPLVARDGGGRHFESLRRDEYVDVWVICWGPDSDTTPTRHRCGDSASTASPTPE